MFSSILAPLDGSHFGEAALPLAGALASGSGSQLHLVHVYDRKPPEHLLSLTAFQYEGVSLDEYVKRYHQQDRAYLTRTAERLGAAHEVSPVTALLEGSVVHGMGDYISEQEVDLVVMSTHGHTGLNRMWLGSVADALIHHVSTPVLLVRPDDSDVWRHEPVERILVPVDLTDHSRGVLEPAARLARATGASVTLLHVNPSFLRAGARSYPIPISSAHRRAHREKAESLLDDITSFFDDATDVDVELREHSAPALGILEAAEESGSDVIAMATHGRTGVARATLGSVTDKVLRGGQKRMLLAGQPLRARETGRASAGPHASVQALSPT